MTLPLKKQKAQKPCVYKVSEPLKYKKTSPGLYENQMMSWSVCLKTARLPYPPEESRGVKRLMYKREGL